MSKNFELLQRVGKERELLPTNLEDQATFQNRLPVAPPRFKMGDAELEEVTKLVQRVFLLPGADAPRTVIFAGTESGNGCSWICSRAAEVLASQVAGSVCLVDANLRAPGLHEQFGISNHHGLSDALLQPEPIRHFLSQLSRPNLALVSCGSAAESSQALLTSDRMRLFVKELRSEFDYVLIDTAAMSLANDSIFLGCSADGVVLVLKANSSRREAARKVVHDFQEAKVRILGAVLNQRSFPIPESIYNRI